ncbi:glutathione transferase GstA [Piscinibacter koreensis]|uniref:Glutathione transferase GstA n=1 Tax=Piscinibacter koreensis TaxID=2742824 RepID=A0A7Y6TUY3_9BURK|nr:glutathione transferase GstA [Schlegelella koreensis]NUZ04356.1 glutathione transferase GstA [Schlegelella koreensis]
MKLYYSPGACSQSVHIVLHEAGLPFEPVLASTKTHQLADGTDYYTINPNGYVPLLELDDGRKLTEVAAIMQYIADQVPDRRLAPPNGEFERYRLQQWLSFVSSELHKTFSPLFNPATPEATKATAQERLLKRLGYVDRELEGRLYLLAERFSVADAYLFVVSGWAVAKNIDISGFANLRAFRDRVAERPSVKAALTTEGFLK